MSEIAESCCVPAESAAMDKDAAVALARHFKALADPARVMLLSMVAGAPAGEACVCDITGPIGLSQSTVSHHLKILVDAGLLTREQRGVWAYYSVVPEGFATLASAVRPDGALVAPSRA